MTRSKSQIRVAAMKRRLWHSCFAVCVAVDVVVLLWHDVWRTKQCRIMRPYLVPLAMTAYIGVPVIVCLGIIALPVLLVGPLTYLEVLALLVLLVLLCSAVSGRKLEGVDKQSGVSVLSYFYCADLSIHRIERLGVSWWILLLSESCPVWVVGVSPNSLFVETMGKHATIHVGRRFLLRDQKFCANTGNLFKVAELRRVEGNQFFWVASYGRFPASGERSV